MAAEHRLRSLMGWLFPFLFALTGCFLTDLGPKPSSGSGVAVIDGKPIAVSLSAQASFFMIVTATNGSTTAQQATVELELRASAGPGPEAEVVLKISGRLAAVPAAEHIGTHTLPVSGTAGGLVETWDIELPADATIISGTLTLSGVTEDVISGTLRLELSAGGSGGLQVRSTYECAISLGRQYGGDGDFDD